MLKTRGRKILRDVMARRGRTILVAVSIMIGVFGAVTLISANDLVVKQIKSDINPSEIAMTRLFVTVPTAGTVVTASDGQDQVIDLLRNQKALPGITTIEGQAIVPVFWKESGGDKYVKGDLMTFSEPFGQIKLEPMRLVSGEWPQPGQNQIAIEQRMADEYHLSVGDTLAFRSPDSAVSAQGWTITAIAFHPYWVNIDGGPNRPERRIFVNLEDAHSIATFSGFTSFYLRYIDKQVAWDQTNQLSQAVAEKTNYIPTGTWTDDPDNYFLIGEVESVTSILNLLGIVALVVSGFLVTNVINTIVVEQKRQIGVMKSLGASRLDNFIIYAGVALIYGVLGTIPGVLLGVVAGSAMANGLAPLASTLITGFHVSTSGIIIGAVMGLIVPVVAALIPVFNGTRVTIRDAMTDLGISTAWGTGPIARLIKVLPLPVTTRQALSNVMQKKGRLALTVITLTLAASAFMGVFAMFTVITDQIENLYSTFQYQILAIPTEAQNFDTVKGMIKGVDGVGEVYPGVGFGVKILDLDGTVLSIGIDENGGDEINALGFDPASSVLELTYSEGTGWQTDSTLNGVVLTQPAADSLHKHAGDHIVVSAGGRDEEYEVLGVISYPFTFILMPWQNLAQQVGFVTSDDVPLPNALLITLVDAKPTATQVDNVIDGISNVLTENGIPANFQNQVQEQEDAADQMLVFNMIFQLTSAVMAAVGAIGLLTTLSMAVFERQKEIGVMRSIGAGSWTIVGQFLVEGLLIGVLAWLLAIPLSYGLALTLLDGLGFADFITFSYPLWVLGLGLVGMLIIATAASLWPSIAAARRTVSDILRYQ